MTAKEYVYRFLLLDKVSSGLQTIARAAGVTQRRMDKMTHSTRAAEYAMNKLNGVASLLKNQLVILFSIGAISAFGSQIVQTTAQVQGLRSAIYFASGTAEEGSKNWKFLSDTSDRLGVDLMASREGFKTLSGAMMGSRLAGQPTRDIFLAVSKAANVMKLTADETKGSFLALGQMMGKGKVQAEELRGQLGERIPGAFNIAARAMNMSTAELDKFMADGKLMAEDFLPKFAAELEKTFGSGVKTEGMRAWMNRAKNAYMELSAAIGNRLTPVIIGLAKAFVGFTHWLRENKDQLLRYAGIIGTGISLLLIYKATVFAQGAAFLAFNAAMNIARLGMILFTGGFSKLNMVLRLNPIGLIVTGISALAIGFVYAYQKSETFRGSIWGLWEASKQVFTNIGNFFKEIFNPIFKAIDNVNNGNYLKAAANVGELAVNLNPVGLAKKGFDFASKGGFTNGVGEAFDKGYASGKDKKIEVPEFLKGFMGGSSFGNDPSNTNNSTTEEDTTFKDGINSVAGGGQKVMHVDIDIEKLQLSENMQLQDFSLEKLEEMSDQVREILMRIVNGAIAKSN